MKIRMALPFIQIQYNHYKLFHASYGWKNISIQTDTGGTTYTENRNMARREAGTGRAGNSRQKGRREEFSR